MRFIKPERETPENPRESGVIGERWITKMFHPVEIVVERVIDAVVAAETDIDRGDARVIEEGTEIGSGTEVTERRLTARLALWRLPGNTGRLLFGASDVPTPGFVNAAAGLGVLDL